MEREIRIEILVITNDEPERVSRDELGSKLLPNEWVKVADKCEAIALQARKLKHNHVPNIFKG